MRISKEVRIGILFIVALVLFFVGFSFLKGANLFSNNNKYYCYFSDIDGLQNSASVQIHGLAVGQVSHMELQGRQVKVEMTLNKKYQLPAGTVANLTSSDLLGAKVIELAPGTGPGIIQNQGTVGAGTEPSAMDKLTNELAPRLRELKNTITILDSALRGVNTMVNERNREAISGAIQAIKRTADNLSDLSTSLKGESGEIASIVTNANKFTSNLAKGNDTINSILANVSAVSKQLADAPMKRTITDLQHATAQLEDVTRKINNKEGSLGLLVNDKELYNNLNGTVASLTALTGDMKANPKRYLNFSVFGGGSGSSAKKKEKKKK
jgi:phospholipid/cholesterol/gamma-HCH transport system substrate-binding protein